MAIDTTAQPWIVKMLTPPDGRLIGEAINNFAKGAATGYLSAKRNERSEIIAAGGTPEEEGRLERVVRLANPEAVNTLDQILSKDLSTIGQETGNLKSAQEIFNWVAKNAALSASPIGRSILSTISENGRRMAAVEADSAGHIAAVQLAKDKAELMVEFGLEPGAPPEAFASARANKREMEFTRMAARDLGKDVSGLVTSSDFDAYGNWAPGAQQRILKAAPRSEQIQSRQEIAAMREALIGQRSQLDRDLRERKITLDEYNALARNVDRQLRGLSLGVEIQNLPAPPFGSTAPIQQAPIPTQPGAPGFEPMAPMIVPPQEPPASPTFKPVERPLTTGAAKNFQEDSIKLDGAIAALSRAQKVVQEVPEAFGIGGIGRELFETATGQINPNAPAKVSKARQEAGLAFVEVADMLRTDSGNMSRYEQERLRELGDIRDWKDYPERAAQKLDSINKMVIAKKIRIAKALKSKIDDNLLRSIPSSEVIGLGSSGLLTEEEAQRWYRLNKQK